MLREKQVAQPQQRRLQHFLHLLEPLYIPILKQTVPIRPAPHVPLVNSLSITYRPRPER